jgi:hypothetical protein
MSRFVGLLSRIFGGEADVAVKQAAKPLKGMEALAFAPCDVAFVSDRDLVTHMDARLRQIGLRSTDRSGPALHGIGQQGTTYTRDPQKLSLFPDVMMVHVRSIFGGGPISGYDEMRFFNKFGQLMYADTVVSFLRQSDSRDLRAAMALYEERMRWDAYRRNR